MEQPKRNCAFQVGWDEDDKEWGCQLIEMGEGEYWCDQSICPFWREQIGKIKEPTKSLEVDSKKFD